MFNLRKMAVSGLIAASLAGTGIAAAAMPASAATTHVATVSTVKPITQPTPHLQGFNVLSLRFNGSTFRYNVFFRSVQIAPRVWIIRGVLVDNFEPVTLTLQIRGYQVGRFVSFHVIYPSVGTDAGNQGTRTFDGNFFRLPFGGFGFRLIGNWSETGTEAGFGPWNLVFPVL